MAATKSNLVDYIVENFEGPDGEEIQKAKIEGYKKADLEEFINQKDSMDAVEQWVEQSR